MKIFILVVYLFSNNAFYGKDAVPTIEFKTEQECKDFISKIKSAKEVKQSIYVLKNNLIMVVSSSILQVT